MSTWAASRSRRNEGTDRRRRFLNAALWLVNLVFVRSSGFVRNLLVARFLAPEIASMGFLAISVGRGALAFFETGTRQVVITAPSCDDALIASAWWVECAKGVGVSLVLVGLGLFGAGLGLGASGPVLLLGALVPLAIGLMSPFTHVWERDQQHGRIVVQTSVSTLAGVLVTGALLAGGVGWKSMPLGLVAGLALHAAWSHRVAGRLPWRWPARGTVWWMLREGAPYLGIGLATYLITFGLDVVLAVCGALVWVGPYRIALSLVQTLLGTVPGVLVRASLPADANLNRAAAPGSAAAADYHAVGVIVMTTAFLTPLCAYILPEVTVPLFGSAWGSAALLVPVLTGVVALRNLSSPLAMVLLAAGRSRLEASIKTVEALATAGSVALLASASIERAFASAAGVAAVAVVARLWSLWALGAQATRAVTYLYAGSFVAVSAFTGIALQLPLASWSGAVVPFARGGLAAVGSVGASWLLWRVCRPPPNHG